MHTSGKLNALQVKNFVNKGDNLQMKVVLLPGLDGTGVLFKPFIDALPNYIDALVISYPPNLKLSYENLVEFVISQLPEENFILIGESFSGYIAYQVALRKPENLKSVIFVATFISNPRPFLLSLSSLPLSSFIFSVPIPNFIIKSFLLGWTANKQVIDLFKQSIKQVLPDILFFRLQEISKIPKKHQLCEIKATYIQATDDKLVPKKCVDNFKKVFNNINVFQIEGSHFILQANPLACAEIVAKL